MRLKRLELIGFKSFRTRLALDIGPGVTVVVGPNGCGKSNVVDAIKWALGTQSAKELRGRSMEDVIFAGSEHHRPAGFAEVTLVFDNSDSTRGGALAGLSELSFTRRLFRTGESVYEINGAKVRLREIQDLFLGTGLGAQNGYSIIEQGRVNEIVSARAEDRRALIEEAAGITRYRSLRKQSERKLELSQDNLARVEDLYREVSAQEAALEAQASRTARWRELSTQQRVHQLSLSLHEYEEATLARDSAQARARLLNQSSDEIAKQLSSQDKATIELRTTGGEIEQRLTAVRDTAHRLRADAALLAQEREHVVADIARMEQEQRSQLRAHSALESQLGSLKSDLQAQQETLSSKNQAADSAQRALEGLSEEWSRASTARGDLISRERRYNERLNTLLSRYAEARGGGEAASRESSRLEQLLEELRTRSDQLAAHSDKLQRSLLNAHRDIERLREAEQLTLVAHGEAKGRLSEASVARSQLIKIEAQSNAAVIKYREELKMLRSSLDSRASYSPWLRGLLQKAKMSGEAQISKPLIELITTESSNDTALLAALGERSFAICVESPEIADRLIEKAREHGEELILAVGELDDRPLDSGWLKITAPISPAARRWLESIELQRPLDLGGTARRAVSADGVWSEADNWRGVVGRKDARAQRILQLRREIEAADSQFIMSTDELERVRAQLHQTLERAEQLEAAERHASETYQSAAAATRAARRQEEEWGRKVRALDQERDRLNSELAAAERALRDSRSRQARSAAELSELLSQREQLTEALASVTQESEQAERRFLTISTHHTQASVAAERSAQELKAARARLSSLHARTRETESQIRGSSQRIDQLGRDIEASLQKQDEQRTTADRATALAERQDTELRKEEELWQSHSSRLREHELAVAALRAEAATAQKQANAATSRAERLAWEADKCREVYEALEPSEGELRAERPSDWTRATCRAELSQITRALKALGPVNPMAEELWADAKARKEELEFQREDLNVAIADLREAMRQIDETCSTLFIQTFEAANSNFKELFPRLFRGGDARLELSDPGDPLTTSVEIFVQPPGKRLQSMSLLSGGEKALSAIALIFALFQLKPAPLSILDEVDAPLDEANVGRYADLIAELSSQSQFLVITHNKRTMEAADLLYGVTMQEPGVSRVVGVSFNEI